MEYTVGQKLWYVPKYGRGRNREVEILKAGRSWLTIKNGRINKDTLLMDGGQGDSPGQCYLSEQAYNAYVRLTTDWYEFRHKIFNLHVVPDGVTVEMIEQVRAMLFGKEGEQDGR